MSEKLQEVLSAAIDDEVTVFEMRRLLHEMENEPEMREQWARYHLVRDFFEHSTSRDRKSPPKLLSKSMDWRALAQQAPSEWDRTFEQKDPRLIATVFERKNRRRVYGIAGALSAVALTVLVWWGAPMQSLGERDTPAAPNSFPIAPSPFYAEPSSSGEIATVPTFNVIGNSSYSLTESQIRRLESLLEVHSHQQSLTQNPRLESYAKLVAHPAQNGQH